MAGSFAQKCKHPANVGTFRTDTGIFGVFLVGFIIVLGVLTFFPALTLGPLLEHLSLQKEILY
ncbi:MAG: potassium-transporting ATPase subunit KdpA [Nitrospirae bacterium]|nr:potassium-transporting ATPase subunit KdpA [Nitrospirota bacterium]MCL5284909.1 potassium-transporting ATPase subunit KdpA [Nitrospirota bacterium]